MPEKIQKIPVGLLDLLGIVGRGTNAAELGDTLIPVLDQFKFYASQQLESQEVTANVLNQGDGVDIDIPAGEYWYVANHAGRVDVAVTRQASFFIGYRPKGIGTLITTAGHYREEAIGNDTSFRISGGEIPVLLPPGSLIRCQLAQDQFATRTAGIGVVFARFTF